MTWAWILLGLAGAASLFVAVQAVRHRILWRMAARNAMRRPRQTATVVAGLMIGTAIISAALVAGGSAQSAIRGAVFDALGPVDETVRTDAFHFYPESSAQAFMDDPRIAEFFDGAAPTVIWSAAASSPSDLFEPQVSLVGYDVGRDAAFGDFELAGGGRTDGRGLGPGQAIITAGLADALEVGAGDRVDLAFTLPVDPLLPEFDLTRDELTASVSTLPPVIGGPVSTEEDLHDVDVPLGTKAVTLVLVCGDPISEEPCPEGTSLRLRLTAPDGEVWETSGTFPSAPSAQCVAGACPPELLWLNVTAGVGEAFDEATWQAAVSADAAVDTPYMLVSAAMRPVYDTDELQRRAEALRSEAGEFLNDTLDLDLFGDRREASVEVVAVTDGGRGSMFDFEHAVFLPLPDLQGHLEREGEVNFVKLSNPGSTTNGHRHTDEALARINATLDDMRAAAPALLVLDFVEPNPVKRTFLDIADDAGQLMTALLIFAGSLTIITGLLLIINIFTMLAEERRGELGMARAVGLTRKDLVRMFLFEGSLYAVAAASVGALLGLALAYVMVLFVNDIIANFGSGFPPIPFVIGPIALPAAFAVGLLLTFVTIFFASRRQARLNIVRAIRQIDEPDRQGAWWMPIAGYPLVATGVAASVTGWVVAWLQSLPASSPSSCECAAVPSLSLQVFGPLVLILGLGLVLRPHVRRKPLDVTLAAVLALYYAMTIFVIRDFQDVQEANIVGPIRGVIMTLAIVVMVAYWSAGPRWLGRALARVKRLQAVALPAVSYPQHKRFRTGMTLAMFSIVILSIGFFSIFGALFEVDPERHTGGYDIEAETTLQVPDLAAYDQGLVPPGTLTSQHRLLDHFSLSASFITVSGERTGQFGPPGHHVYGVDRGFIEDQDFRLLWTLDGLSEDETYDRLLTEPGTVIVSYPYSTNRQGQDLAHEVGETLRIHTGDCTVGGAEACPEYTIIGIQEQYHFLGVFLPEGEVDRLFPQAESLYLFKVADGEDAGETAKLLERNYRDVGMDAEDSVAQVEKEQEGFRQILAGMKLFLALGLIVGVLSLGIVTSRSVLERRQEVGMLRALGYTRRQVRRIFLIEVSLVIFAGVVIGFLCSVIVTFGLWFAIIRELQYPYVIPWLEVFWLFLAAYVVALLATMAPIIRVGRVAPAEALRYVE